MCNIIQQMFKNSKHNEKIIELAFKIIYKN